MKQKRIIPFLGILIILLIIPWMLSFLFEKHIQYNCSTIPFGKTYRWKNSKQLPDGYYLDFNMSFDGLSRIQNQSHFCRRLGLKGSQGLKQATFDQNTGDVYEGIVDARVFTFKGKRYLSGVKEEWKPDYMTSMLVFDMVTKEKVQLTYEKQHKVEKNWIAFEYDGELYFSYTIHPKHIVLKCDLESGKCTPAYETNSTVDFTAPHVRATSNLVDYGSAYLGLAHFHIFGSLLRQRQYFHLFYLMEKEPPFRLTFAKKYFRMPCNDPSICHIQFAMGLERTGNTISIGFGEGDCTNNVAEMSLADVKETFE